MNQYNAIGRLTKDPELSAMSNGTAVCRVRLAVDGAGRGRNDNGRPNAGFINVTQFGPGAQAAGEYLKQGSLVAVSGRMEWHSWKDEGKTRETHQIVGEIRFLDNLRTPEGRGRDFEHQQAAGAAAEAGDVAAGDTAAPTPEQLAAEAPRRASSPAGSGIER